MVFAKRPIKLKELQEAICSYCLTRTRTNIETELETGCPDIRPMNIPHADKLINRCTSFVTYVARPQDRQNGTFRLAHQSVLKFLQQKHWAEQDIWTVDEAFMATACLNYLFQARYCKLLSKKPPSCFRTYSPATDVRDHHFLQYCAKYWYRHLDNITPTGAELKKVVAFVKSPQFVTALQVQSLFVDGHFIQHLDGDNQAQRVVKKNLPDCLEKAGAHQYKLDYLEFLAEWGPFLQRGIAESVNGELDRCLWSTLGQENYFSRYSTLQRYCAHLLTSSTNQDFTLAGCIESPLYECDSIILWRSKLPL